MPDRDVIPPRNPGEPGSKQGQIGTPMCTENVSNEGGGKTHDYSGTMNLNAAGPSDGNLRTSNSILGPGAQGDWDTPSTPGGGVSIQGTNLKKGKY